MLAVLNHYHCAYLPPPYFFSCRVLGEGLLLGRWRLLRAVFDGFSMLGCHTFLFIQHWQKEIQTRALVLMSRESTYVFVFDADF